MPSLYLVSNGVMPTSAAQVVVATGVSSTIKTMLQIKPTRLARIKEWGIFFDAILTDVPIRVELCETGTVFATVTTHADANVPNLTNPAGDAAASSSMSHGTTATGFTASAEGTVTAVRYLEPPLFVPRTGSYQKQFPLGGEPVLQINNACRIRVTNTLAAAVNCYCYVVLES